jgi:hypothetical protein
MTTQTRPATPVTSRQRATAGAAAGLAAFTGVMMVLAGTLHALQGVVALTNGSFFVYAADYVFEFDLTTWGLIHLVAGAVVVAAGFGVLTGATWARVVAGILAGASFVTSFLWLPYYPLWSLVVMALDACILWSVTGRGRGVTDL